MKNTDWVLPAAHPTRVERLEARFAGHGFNPHRHDTYAIGRTLAGVQSFNYRRALRHSLPGGTLVLHPDEVHDGQAGTEAGFQYRMIYVEPALIQQVLGGKPLPFIEGGLSNDPRLFAATQVLLGDMHSAIDSLAEDDALYEVAQALAAAAGQRPERRALDFVAAERAREFIHATLGQPVSLDDLAQASGRDRWALSRDFRALYGTSPYRYIVQRRLDTVRRALRAGGALVDAAMIAGFHDQAHMTRLFGQAYGVSPGRWARMLGAHRPATL
ncbi:AraC family transcriptional regulator [Pseudomonas putida]